MIATTQDKIACAVKQCLAQMDDECEAAALVAETDYISQLEADGLWTKEEIKEFQKQINAARNAGGHLQAS